LTPYLRLDDVLINYAQTSRDVLADNFVGLYLLGSLAIGDFDLTSDVDFMVATKDELSDDWVGRTAMSTAKPGDEPCPGGLLRPPLASSTNESPRIRRYARRNLTGSPPLGARERHVAAVRGTIVARHRLRVVPHTHLPPTNAFPVEGEPPMTGAGAARRRS
jgi:hypothetical protein